MDTSESKGGGGKGKSKKKGKKQKGKDDTPKTSEVEEKKSSMKTAEDVISRIMWDEQLPKDDFTVGYLDRFVGKIEFWCSFTRSICDYDCNNDHGCRRYLSHKMGYRTH